MFWTKGWCCSLSRFCDVNVDECRSGPVEEGGCADYVFEIDLGPEKGGRYGGITPLSADVGSREKVLLVLAELEHFREDLGCHCEANDRYVAL